MIKKLLLFIFLLPFFVEAQQIIDTTVLPLNRFLFIQPPTGCSLLNLYRPYPQVNETVLKTIDTTSFKKSENYGLVGDGTTLNDNAFVSLFNAANSANSGGVIIRPGVYLMANNHQISLSHSLKILAKGVTLKMDNLQGGSMLNFNFPNNSTDTLMWIGGIKNGDTTTLDGNQYNQRWPYNPHGGIYDTRQYANDSAHNQGFDEAHSRMLGAVNAGFALFDSIVIANCLMDGITGEGNTLTVISHCWAYNGANYHFNTEVGSTNATDPGVGEQGTYVKGRVTGANQAFYFLNIHMEGGSIGLQMSFSESSGSNGGLAATTTSFIANCYTARQEQDLMHIEDCYKNYFVKDTFVCPNDGNYYQPRIWISNRTGVAGFKECRFTNSYIHFRQAAGVDYEFVDNCSFYNELHAVNTFMSGTEQLLTRSSFNGQCGAQQAQVLNAKNCTFTNFSNYALKGIVSADSLSFTNGTNAVGLLQSSTGVVQHSTYYNVTNHTYNNSTTNGWDDIFDSYEVMIDDKGTFLGEIDCKH